LNTYFINELMRKSGVRDKFALTRFAIKRAKELIKEKEKRVLLDSEKLTTRILKEIHQGKLKSEESPPGESSQNNHLSNN